jgi:hypothetical protein
MKIDVFEDLAGEYLAGDEPAVVETSPAWYVAAPGQGPPGEGEFDGKLAAVMATAGAVAADYAAEGRGFAVGKLEAVWWTDAVEGIDFAARPRDEWKWKLMVRVPDFVAAERATRAARHAASEQKPGAVALEGLDEGRCVQMLHCGPYKDVYRAMAAIGRFAAERGLEITGRHHEICVTDPRHTALADMRTIVRYSVR